jgi:hypothetical protein
MEVSRERKTVADQADASPQERIDSPGPVYVAAGVLLSQLSNHERVPAIDVGMAPDQFPF